MSTMYRYTLPVEQTKWKFDGKTETCFTWEYDDSRAALLQLYDKARSSNGTPRSESTGRSISTLRTR